MLYRQAAILELTGSLLDTPAVLGLNFSMRDQMRKAKRTYGYLLLSMEHSAGYRSHVQSFASFHSYDLYAFLSGLQTAYEQSQGSARLVDADGNTMLCMTMFDRTTDRAVFGGQVQYLVGPSDVCCADHFLDEPGGNGGIAVTFDGFITDTNSVKSLLAFIDSFLQSNEIANDPPTW